MASSLVRSDLLNDQFRTFFNAVQGRQGVGAATVREGQVQPTPTGVCVRGDELRGRSQERAQGLAPAGTLFGATSEGRAAPGAPPEGARRATDGGSLGERGAPELVRCDWKPGGPRSCTGSLKPSAPSPAAPPPRPPPRRRLEGARRPRRRPSASGARRDGPVRLRGGSRRAWGLRAPSRASRPPR